MAGAKIPKNRPLLNAVIRRRVIVELHKSHGYSMADARAMADEGLSDDLIHDAIDQTPEAVGAIGDGKILQTIIDFIQSPQGQALIALLIKLLTGGI